jgi:hypothetical protein
MGLKIVQLIIALTLLAASYCMAADQTPAFIEWKLSDMKVVNMGTVSSGAEGSMRSGVRIEGKAVTETPGAIFPEGKFTVKVNVFNPAEDIQDQKAGNWYLRGEWSITAQGAGQEELKSRYNPYSLSGMFTGSLPYDPAAKTGAMELEMKLQRGGMKPRTGRMQTGKFTGTSDFAGILTTPFIPSTTK